MGGWHPSANYVKRLKIFHCPHYKTNSLICGFLPSLNFPFLDYSHFWKISSPLYEGGGGGGGVFGLWLILLTNLYPHFTLFSYSFGWFWSKCSFHQGTPCGKPYLKIFNNIWPALASTYLPTKICLNFKRFRYGFRYSILTIYFLTVIFYWTKGF